MNKVPLRFLRTSRLPIILRSLRLHLRPLRLQGQSTVEYAVLIAVVIGALLTMQIFVKRGAQGKLRDATDQIGEQFSPRGTTYKYTTATASTREEKLENTPASSSFGKSTSTIVQRVGTQTGDTQTKTFNSPEIVDTNQ